MFFCGLHRELCVVFFKKYFMKLKTESKAENECMDLLIWCVLLLFELCTQLKKTVNAEARLKNIKYFFFDQIFFKNIVKILSNVFYILQCSEKFLKSNVSYFKQRGILLNSVLINSRFFPFVTVYPI